MDKIQLQVYNILLETCLSWIGKEIGYKQFLKQTTIKIISIMTDDNFKELLFLASRTRMAQKDYFLNRTPQLLRVAKARERDLDRLIEEYIKKLNDEYQGTKLE